MVDNSFKYPMRPLTLPEQLYNHTRGIFIFMAFLTYRMLEQDSVETNGTQSDSFLIADHYVFTDWT